MTTGAITPAIDLAQVVLYLFWIFFAGLIIYLHRENKREGYPLVADGPSRRRGPIQGFPAVPEPKTFLLRDGRTRQAPPGGAADPATLNLERGHDYPGAPYEPVGNPLLAGVGPGAYAQREDVVDLTLEGAARIVPLRVAAGFGVAGKDVDPRGLAVRGADRVVAGTVVDLWVDRSENLFRYLEVDLGGGKVVLLPVNFARISAREVQVDALLGHQFADVPGTRSPAELTLLEEERITAYFGAGTLYAEPSRAEPFL
ncbi:MAG: photosynthetic reaction center subunit [Pseudomonadota bacterium]|jgi:photosynthetic reaction center H subunit